MELIFNADDFGRSTSINRAVIRAHVEGVLTSASLMVAGEAADEAIELARQHPSLAVGLHVVAVDGAPVLPPERIPHLVDERGRFPNAPISAGLKYAFGKRARRELSAEIAAQFERFAATGLPLAHVDGHQHMHMHPAVFDIVWPLAKRYSAKRVRIVRDDLKFGLRYDWRGAAGKLISTAIFAMLAYRCRRIGSRESRRTYGLLQSGAMSEQYVLAVMQQLSASAEVYFHPTDGPRLDKRGPNPQDLAALLSPAVRRAVEAWQLHDARRHESPDSSPQITAP